MEVEEGLPRLKNHKLSLTCVCLDSEGKHAFTASKDGSIIKWDLGSKKILLKISSLTKNNPSKKDKNLLDKRHTRHINCIAISSDDKYLASGGWDKKIIIWSPKTLDWIHTFKMHRQEVTALSFRDNHLTLYSGSADRSVMIWSLEDDDNLCFVEALYGHESTITSLDSTKKERVLSAGGRDESIRIWKIVEQAQTVFQSKHESVDVAKFIDDKMFVSGGEDGSISVWTPQKRSPLCSIRSAHGNAVSCDVSSSSLGEKFHNFWISSLATVPISESKQVLKNNSKRRKIDLVDDEDEGGRSDQDEDESSDHEEEPSDAENNCDDGSKQAHTIALIASGSSDSKIRLWKLLKSGGKHQLVASQTIDCPGFINDMKFTKNGKCLVVACGQEHRFGRWWRLKASKNCLRLFDIKS